jgi:hypothetical protein
MPEDEKEVELKNVSAEDFAKLLEAAAKALAEYDRDVAAMRAREGELLNMRFTI